MIRLALAALACAVFYRQADDAGIPGAPESAVSVEEQIRIANLDSQWKAYLGEVVENSGGAITLAYYQEIKDEWHDRVAPGLPHFGDPAHVVQNPETGLVGVQAAVATPAPPDSPLPPDAVVPTGTTDAALTETPETSGVDPIQTAAPVEAEPPAAVEAQVAQEPEG